jgi:Tfp pilus assembly protein FimT
VIDSRSSRPDFSGPCFARSRAHARALVRGRAVSGSGARAFTLTEILIAICLILLVTGLVVTNFSGLTENVDKFPVEVVLREAIREARFQALTSKRNTNLAFDTERSVFVVTDYLTGATLAELPTKLDPDLEKVEIVFTPILPLNDLTSDIHGTPEFSKNDQDHLVFHSTGTSTPVRITLKVGTNPDKEIMLDAFSEGEPPKEPSTLIL